MDFDKPKFRLFLIKIKYESLLDYSILCQKILCKSLSNEEKHILMKEVGKYLLKPPEGNNLAVRCQINRFELLKHCQQLDKHMDINIQLLKQSYDYIYYKLVEKYNFFKQKHIC